MPAPGARPPFLNRCRYSTSTEVGVGAVRNSGAGGVALTLHRPAHRGRVLLHGPVKETSRVRNSVGCVAPLAIGMASRDALLAGVGIGRAGEEASTRTDVDVQILGLNDFHGQLEVVDPIASSGGRIGSLQGRDPLPEPSDLHALRRAASPPAAPSTSPLTSRNLRADEPENTVFVSAGDLIGATPLLSALFHDEPTIEAFNLMGLDYNGVGNHEFDEGIDELLRMQYGNEPGPGYVPAAPMAAIRSTAAATATATGRRLRVPGRQRHLQGHAARRSSRPTPSTTFPGGVKVAFVGMTLEGTPTDRLSRRHRDGRLPRRGRIGQRARSRSSSAGRRGDRRAAPRGRQRPAVRATADRQRRTADQQLRQPDRRDRRRSSTPWTTRSTSSSPATPTGRSTA